MESVSSLFITVEQRASALVAFKFSEKPKHHSQVSFETVSETDLLAKASGLIGSVLSCEASAAHSRVEGDSKKTIQKDKSATFSVRAKDSEGRSLGHGGDSVRAKLSGGNATTETATRSSVEVKDKGDGLYDIICSPASPGDYQVVVFVNDAKLPTTLTFTCQPPDWFDFDTAECQGETTISPDKRNITHTGRENIFSSVLGSCGARVGRHSWRVNVNKSQDMDIFLGVAEKPGLTARSNNYSHTYGWYGINGCKWVMGTQSDSIGKFQVNDMLQLDLDCDTHSLKITNLRLTKTEIIDNLPAAELFPYFSTYNSNDSLSLSFRE